MIARVTEEVIDNEAVIEGVTCAAAATKRALPACFTPSPA